jgi:ubiquinone/menaquinone biosynthesis C-methylase UbiE
VILPDLRTRFFDPTCPEQMDLPDLDPDELSADLANLRTINRWFGGHSAARFAAARASSLPSPTLLDAACGSGDLTRLQCRLLRPSRAVAVDLHPQTLAEARRQSGAEKIEWIVADITQLPFPDATFDLVTCHLALHHFAEADAVRVLRELRRVARRHVVVADLERSRAAYVGVWLLVHLWLRAPMTQHDALLSVRRAFNREELVALARAADWPRVEHHTLPWHRQAICLDLEAG